MMERLGGDSRDDDDRGEQRDCPGSLTCGINEDEAHALWLSSHKTNLRPEWV